MTTDDLKKRYKKFKVLWFAFYVSAIACCVLPELVGALVMSKGKEGSTFLALSGFAVCILAIMLLIVFRNIVKKYADKVPITVKTLFAFVILVVLLNSLQKCLDEAIYIAFLGLIGAIVGTVTELASICFKNVAEDAKSQYNLMISGTAKTAEKAEKESK